MFEILGCQKIYLSIPYTHESYFSYLCNNTNYDMWLIRNKPNICTHAVKSSAKIKCKTTIM